MSRANQTWHECIDKGGRERSRADGLLHAEIVARRNRPGRIDATAGTGEEATSAVPALAQQLARSPICCAATDMP